MPASAPSWCHFLQHHRSRHSKHLCCPRYLATTASCAPAQLCLPFLSQIRLFVNINVTPEQETPESVIVRSPCACPLPGTQAPLLLGSVYNETAVCRQGGRLHQASILHPFHPPDSTYECPLSALGALPGDIDDSYSNLRVTGSLKYTIVRLREGLQTWLCPSCLGLENGMSGLDIWWQGVVPLCVKFSEEVEAVGWTG